MLKNKLIWTFLLLPVIGYATATPLSSFGTTYPYLKNGLNISKANQCLSVLKSCQDPKTGPLPNDVCVQQKIKVNPPCNQLQQLAGTLATSPALLSVTAVPQGFAVVKKYYPADGQTQNYIISPTGFLVDTQMDPRLYSSLLKVQYPKNDFLMSSGDLVKTKKSLGRTVFTSTVKVSDGCLACNVLGYATTRFVFKKDGSLQSVRLLSFTKQENAQLAH